MDLFPPLRRALAEQNYKQPTPIQAQTIPSAIEGLDILGCAQTGTGKTAAFALPILDYLGTEKPPTVANRPSALVLAPTRELAIQISESFRTYGKHMRFRQALVYGGVGKHEQIKALGHGVDVLIATPGRLLDLMNLGYANLSDIEIFVLDEADRMLDMGFLPALKQIIAALPKKRQSLFFSATLPPQIRKLSEQLLFNPARVNVTPKSTTVKQTTQSVRFVHRENKLASLINVLAGDGVDRAIVFTRTKHGANGLAKKLERARVSSVAIHGNKTQNARQAALEAFRQKRVKVLVATDVAARGIDIDGVTHVINYDMPVEPESYVHRIGRTGRAGADGIAISFCTVDERSELQAIEKLIGQRLRIENPESRFAASEPSTSKQNSARKSSRQSGAEKSKSQARTRKPRVIRPSKKTEGSRSGSKYHRAPVA